MRDDDELSVVPLTRALHRELPELGWSQRMPPRVGLEPTTLPLTAGFHLLAGTSKARPSPIKVGIYQFEGSADSTIHSFQAMCFGEKSANELEKATGIRKLHKRSCHECKAQLGHALNDRSEPTNRRLLFMSNVSGRSAEVERFNLQLPPHRR